MHVVLFTHVFKWSFYPHSKCTWYVDHQYASTAISAEQLYNMFHGYIECVRMFIISDSFEEAHTLFKQCWIDYLSFYSNKVTLHATAHDHYIQILPLKQTIIYMGLQTSGKRIYYSVQCTAGVCKRTLGGFEDWHTSRIYVIMHRHEQD